MKGKKRLRERDRLCLNFAQTVLVLEMVEALEKESSARRPSRCS